MAARAESIQPAVDISEDIRAMPRVVIDAFFDGSALSSWWPATRSVTTPRPLGPYAIEWMTETRDEVLGRFGGVFRGTVMHIENTRGFFVADVFWLPPNGTPIGPIGVPLSGSQKTSATKNPRVFSICMTVPRNTPPNRPSTSSRVSVIHSIA